MIQPGQDSGFPIAERRQPFARVRIPEAAPNKPKMNSVPSQSPNSGCSDTFEAWFSVRVS